VPLPETIAVKYTEEEAEYLSVRPMVRQTFRPAELVDMILGVTGKDLLRIQQIIRSGTVVFHFYRYWWQGFEADGAALEELLASYPDSDASRAFRAGDCAEIILEPSGSPARSGLHIRRDDARKRRFLRTRTFWDCLMLLARDAAPKYREYSYSLRADIYSAPLNAPQLASVTSDATRYAPPALRAQIASLHTVSNISFVCPRVSTKS
jgi:hypothetical protein